MPTEQDYVTRDIITLMKNDKMNGQLYLTDRDKLAYILSQTKKNNNVLKRGFVDNNNNEFIEQILNKDKENLNAKNIDERKFKHSKSSFELKHDKHNMFREKDENAACILTHL